MRRRETTLMRRQPGPLRGFRCWLRGAVQWETETLLHLCAVERRSPWSGRVVVAAGGPSRWRYASRHLRLTIVYRARGRRERARRARALEVASGRASEREVVSERARGSSARVKVGAQARGAPRGSLRRCPRASALCRHACRTGTGRARGGTWKSDCEWGVCVPRVALAVLRAARVIRKRIRV